MHAIDMLHKSRRREKVPTDIDVGSQDEPVNKFAGMLWSVTESNEPIMRDLQSLALKVT